MIAALFQLDGKLPNIALMRLSFHLKSQGHVVVFKHAGNFAALEPELGEKFDAVYASLIFQSTKDLALRTAWDNARDEHRLMRGLELLVSHGVRPEHLLVYMLIGNGESAADREHRRKRLRDFGALPYPMLFTRNSELAGFQRWVMGGHDLVTPWEEWVDAKYQGREINRRKQDTSLRLPGLEVIQGD